MLLMLLDIRGIVLDLFCDNKYVLKTPLTHVRYNGGPNGAIKLNFSQVDFVDGRRHRLLTKVAVSDRHKRSNRIRLSRRNTRYRKYHSFANRFLRALNTSHLLNN